MPNDSLVFEVMVPAPDLVPVFVFTLSLRGPDGEADDHTFETYAQPGAGATLALGGLVFYDKKGDQQVNLSGIMRYFQQAMPDADYRRLDALIDAHPEITIDHLAEVFEKVVEKQVGRPLGLRLDSRPGRSGSGRSSTARRSSAASI